jgi:hypothetical protein
MASEENKELIVGTLAAEGIEDLQDLSSAENIGFSGEAGRYGILFGLVIILVPNDLGFTLYSVINDMTDNWLLHFVTVFLVEHLEVFGLVVYFRYFYKGKKEIA